MHVEKTEETADSMFAGKVRALANGVIARLSDSVSGYVAFPSGIFENCLDEVSKLLDSFDIAVIKIGAIQLVFAQRATILASTDACIVSDTDITDIDGERCVYSLVADASMMIKQANEVADYHKLDLLAIVEDVAEDRIRSVPLSKLAQAEAKHSQLVKQLRKKAKKFAKVAVNSKRGKKAVKTLEKAARKLSKKTK